MVETAVWRGLQTLRCKLAAVFLAVFGLIQIGLCAAVLVSRERDLREQFDARLLDRAWIGAKRRRPMVSGAGG
jgi:hypothetical protein